MRNFRIVAGIALFSVCFILSYLILSYRVQNINFWFAFDLIVLIIGTMSFFASIHPSVAEGIQTSFLVESYLSSGYDYMQKCIPVICSLFSRLGENFKPYLKKGKMAISADSISLLSLFFNSTSQL
jgi:hypothetical protein